MNVKKLIRERINRGLAVAGFELRPFHPDCSKSLGGSLEGLRRRRVSETVYRAVSESWLGAGLSLDTIAGWVDEFSDLMRDPPFLQTKGGAGYSNGVLLYVVTKALKPAVIVESGVFRGMSTWVLSKAAPSAEIHCFDIDFSHLDFKAPNATYYKNDWTKTPLTLPDNTLGFFDDHVNHARRIIEAKERGISNLLFDDDVPLTAAYADIEMLIPTVSMTLDPEIKSLSEVSWAVGSRQFRAKVDQAQVDRAISLIAEVVRLPRLVDETMLVSSPYTAVKLN